MVFVFIHINYINHFDDWFIGNKKFWFKKYKYRRFNSRNDYNWRIANSLQFMFRVCLLIFLFFTYLISFLIVYSCGVNWHQDHVTLDCVECGGYAMERPCPECDGKCNTMWRRNLSMVFIWFISFHYKTKTIEWRTTFEWVIRLRKKTIKSNIETSFPFIADVT